MYVCIVLYCIVLYCMYECMYVCMCVRVFRTDFPQQTNLGMLPINHVSMVKFMCHFDAVTKDGVYTHATTRKPKVVSSTTQQAGNR